MCGRFTIDAGLEEIMNTFMVDQNHIDYNPNYNVAPTHKVPVVINEGSNRVLDAFQWGLIPVWAKDKKIGYKMINARAETVSEKPAYGRLLKSKRVVIPSTGFYEWKKEGSDKQPYRFQLKDKSVYGFAGLWDEWTESNGEKIRSCTIITTRPNELVEDVHDRMPVILDVSRIEAWLDPEMSDNELLQSFLVPYNSDSMIRYPVSKKVGNVRNNTPELIEEVSLNSL